VAEVISATHLARSLIRQLLELGVSDFVLSPGSRNAPLSIALFQADSAGLAELHVRLDERGAAYFALGISKASDKYVAVICTSGTAAANYHPAILEARHSNTKLLVITADRPSRLRNTGANQTTLQAEIFPHIASHDLGEIVDLEKILVGGPIHLNVQFDEPLLPQDDLNWLAGLVPKRMDLPNKVPVIAEFGAGGVLIIGHDHAGISKKEISDFAADLGWPVIAEDPLSFSESVPHAAIFLVDEKIRLLLRPTSVIVIGRTTLSRIINTFIQSAPRQIVIDPRIATIDRDRASDQSFTDLPKIQSMPEPLSGWMKLWRKISAQTAAIIAQDATWSEQVAVNEIVRHLPNESALFVGSSRPIRDIEAFAVGRSGIEVFANRGLAGIDGNIATAMGIATKFERAYALLGDLTFLHDLSALVNLPKVNLTIFVIDNNGGGIFSTLPQADVTGFETIFGTPHNHDIAKIVRGFGLPADRVKTYSDIQQIIAHQSPGIEVVVVEVPNREHNAWALKKLLHNISSAVRIGNNLD
jgi:2-succinyl-5-enolpyruvyl-6-hydroxy-3-cyclohexene-1-carboxylate synthase